MQAPPPKNLDLAAALYGEHRYALHCGANAPCIPAECRYYFSHFSRQPATRAGDLLNAANALQKSWMVASNAQAAAPWAPCMA